MTQRSTARRGGNPLRSRPARATEGAGSPHAREWLDGDFPATQVRAAPKARMRAGTGDRRRTEGRKGWEGGNKATHIVPPPHGAHPIEVAPLELDAAKGVEETEALFLSHKLALVLSLLHRMRKWMQDVVKGGKGSERARPTSVNLSASASSTRCSFSSSSNRCLRRAARNGASTGAGAQRRRHLLLSSLDFFVSRVSLLLSRL
jgi:hypothetical protein